MSAKSRREQIEALLAEEPNDAFLRYGLAMEHRSEGNLDKAVASFRELLQLAPDYVPGYLMAAQLLAQVGEEDEACLVLRKGILVARQVGDEHAAGEMTSLLATLE